MEEMRNRYKILPGKSEGKRPRRRWENSINIDVKEIVCGGVDWIEYAQDRDQLENL
jgi:hypothetical protein